MDASIRRVAILFLLLAFAVACSQPAALKEINFAVGASRQEDQAMVPPPAADPGLSLTSRGTLVVPSATIASSSGVYDSKQIDQLQWELEELVAGLSGTYGVTALNLSTGDAVGFNESNIFPSASLYKLIVLYETYRQVETGTINLSSRLEILSHHLAEAAPNDLNLGDRLSVGEALRLMVTASSNSAAFAILDEIGWNRLACRSTN